MGTPRNADRLRAQLAGQHRYKGLPCKRHPEADGERYQSSGTCVLCCAASSYRNDKRLRHNREAA